MKPEAPVKATRPRGSLAKLVMFIGSDISISSCWMNYCSDVERITHENTRLDNNNQEKNLKGAIKSTNTK
jgi:hypothetical protein